MKIPNNKKLSTFGFVIVAALLIGAGVLKQMKKSPRGGGSPVAAQQPQGGGGATQPGSGNPRPGPGQAPTPTPAPAPNTSPGAGAATPPQPALVPRTTIDAVIKRIDEAPQSRYPESKKRQLKGLLNSASEIQLVATVNFPVGSNEVDAGSGALLQGLTSGGLSGFNRSAQQFVLVVGYASPDGPLDLNLDLAEKRAASVSSYLSGTAKLDASRVREISVGETELLNSKDKTKNRAVEVWLVEIDPTKIRGL